MPVKINNVDHFVGPSQVGMLSSLWECVGMTEEHLPRRIMKHTIKKVYALEWCPQNSQWPVNAPLRTRAQIMEGWA